MAQPNDHAAAALEHLISALREEGVTIHIYSQGYGAPRGMDYRAAGESVASCDWQNGLEGAEGRSRVSGLIRSHVALYYVLYPGEAGAATAEELAAAQAAGPCMDDTAAAY